MQSLAVVIFLEGTLNIDFLAHLRAIPHLPQFLPQKSQLLQTRSTPISVFARTGLLVSARTRFLSPCEFEMSSGKILECMWISCCCPFCSQELYFLKSCLYWLLSNSFKKSIYMFCLAFIVRFDMKRANFLTGYFVIIVTVSLDTYSRTHGIFTKIDTC